MSIRHLDAIPLPQPPSGRPPGWDQARPIGSGSGAIPPGYGRLVVILKCARGQQCGPHASVALRPATAYGYISTIVPAVADTQDGSPCWADVPAGSWTVTWHTTHGSDSVAMEILPGRLQGFAVDLPTGAQPIRLVGQPIGRDGHPTLNAPPPGYS